MLSYPEAKYKRKEIRKRMRKTNKNLPKQILTLMLAFVMVFTGMGIGSWGVDKAWADEEIESLQTIIISVNGITGEGCDVKSLEDVTITTTEKAKKPNAVANKIYAVTIKDAEAIIKNNTTFKLTATYSSCLDSEKYIVMAKNRGKTIKTLSETDSSSGIKIQKNLLKNCGLKEENIDSQASEFFYVHFDFSAKRGEIFGLLVQVVPETVSRDELETALRNINLPKKEDYYTENDRWNGKTSSGNGFWTDMQNALNEAKEFFVDNDMQNRVLESVTDRQLELMHAKLEKRIDALIPKTQANTTKLYEAIKESEKFDTSLSYNSDNLALFTEKQTAAETLLSSLFEKGKATEANKPRKQDDINKTASELKDSYSDDKMNVEISTQEALTNFLTKANNGVKGRLLNDLTLTGYDRVSSFNGELDGNGHTLTIDTTYKGLVDINNGTIRNLTICGADLNSVSAICRINYGLLEGCSNTANFSNEESNSRTQNGAICSINERSGIIRGCYNTGKLTGQYVGGICGQNYGLVENCLNTGMILSEGQAGGIVWRNHNNSESSGIGGTIRNCYNFNVMHHTAGWDSFYGSYIGKNLGPICGDNERSSVSISATSSKKIYVEGTVENGLYLDTVISNKPNGRPLSIALSDIYLAQKKAYDNLGAGTSAGTAIAGWTEKDRANSIFAYGTDYYVFYDNTNGHFIAVTFDDAAASAVIDAAKPSAQSELCKSAAGAEKEFYLVKVPTGTKAVTFKNTEMIIDYANGYTNRYVKAYQQLDNFGVNFGPELSRKFVGTAIGSSDVSTILSKVSAICGSDTATVAFVKEMLSGVETQSSIVTPSEKEIKVSFRLVGATKSPSGNYDAKTNKDSQYVTWIATRTYSLKDGSSVGDLLKLAIKESGIKTVGEENNYVSGVYAPNVLGNYYLAEFTNGTRSGWMYTVNRKHPSVGLNGYYLKDGDSVIWHYINDYSYEVSDWFDDPLYPNLGNASTWDPWLKVPDVDPTKDTPTVGGAQTEEVKNVTTDTKSGTTTAPTEVKVSEKTNADGTKTKVADVKVSADNQKEILKQAKASKSKEIILNVSSKSVGDATKADVTLEKSFIDSIVKDTNAKLTIKTPFGDKTYTQDELKAMSEAATGSTVTVVIEKATEEPTDDAAAKIEKAKSIVKDMKLVARSSKTAKKNIKAVLKSDAKVTASIKELKDLGFTVKYRFYRSTKKAAGYKAAVTKKTASYTNTSGKKGTKYFYKVQVRVYDENGKLIAKTALKQCKYASRVWTK